MCVCVCVCGKRIDQRENGENKKEQKGQIENRYKRLSMCGNTCRNLLDESGLRHGHFNAACCYFASVCFTIVAADARSLVRCNNSSVWKCVQQKKNILIGKCDWEPKDRVPNK